MSDLFFFFFRKVQNRSREGSSLRLHLRRQARKTQSCYTRTHHDTPTLPKGSNTVTPLTDLPPSLLYPLYPQPQPQPWRSTTKATTTTTAHPPPPPPQNPKSVPGWRATSKNRRGDPNSRNPDFRDFRGYTVHLSHLTAFFGSSFSARFAEFFFFLWKIMIVITERVTKPTPPLLPHTHTHTRRARCEADFGDL